MPFGNLFQCFKEKVGDVAEQYGGEQARDLVEEGIKQLNVDENEAGGAGGGPIDVDSMLQAFTGKQQVCFDVHF